MENKKLDIGSAVMIAINPNIPVKYWSKFGKIVFAIDQRRFPESVRLYDVRLDNGEIIDKITADKVIPF